MNTLILSNEHCE